MACCTRPTRTETSGSLRGYIAGDETFSGPDMGSASDALPSWLVRSGGRPGTLGRGPRSRRIADVSPRGRPDSPGELPGLPPARPGRAVLAPDLRASPQARRGPR